MICHDPEKLEEKEVLLRSHSPSPSLTESVPPPYSDAAIPMTAPTGIYFLYGLFSTVLFLSLLHASSWIAEPLLRQAGITPTTGKKPDFKHLHYTKLCPALDPIDLSEFQSRRDVLGDILSGGDGKEWGAWVSEPGPNTLYYTNLTASNWYLSERPWLVAITPSSSPALTGSKAHLSVLTPSFELSRSQRLPFAISDDSPISWVTWEEAENPYQVLIAHLDELRRNPSTTASETGWTIELEENVREFVSAGLTEAGQDLKAAEASEEESNLVVRFAKLELREQRMRKTEAERKIQRCAAKVTLESIREVRKYLKIGMTELDGESLIRNALTSAGLTSLDIISLFGANAALPHASASASKRLKKGEFVLFDCGGSLLGYESDFTRTVLPDPTKINLGLFSWLTWKKEGREWPNERAEKVWETVKAAQVAALGALLNQDGADGKEIVWAANVDKAARDVITDAGWGKYFSHRLGHGIGLQVHEHPYLNSGNFQPLQEGETFSNEPGIYIETSVDTEGGGIGVRLEDMVLKTEDGWELISGELLARSPWEP